MFALSFFFIKKVTHNINASNINVNILKTSENA